MSRSHARRKRAPAALLAPAVLMTACASGPAPGPTNLPLGDPGRRDRELTLVPGTIVDARSGDRVAVDALAARLDGKRLVLFGETHAQPAVQAAERQLLDALARRGRRVLVGLEMLPATVQPALDRWVGGEGTEEDLIRASHWYLHWGFHFGHYRELFRFARQHRTPLIALNIEREVITQVRKSGLDSLPPGDRSKLPDRVDVQSEAHRQLFAAFMGGGAHGGGSPAETEGMFRAQCTWDAVMAHNAVEALAAEKDPRAVMVVMAGVGHVVYGLGIERQAALWGREPAAAVVALAALDDQGRPAPTRASVADFLWAMPAFSDVPLFPSLGATLVDKPGVSGPTVTKVRPASPAQQAGLFPGDVVIAVDGQSTPDKESVQIRLGAKAWGDKLGLEILRGGRRRTFTVVLPSGPS